MTTTINELDERLKILENAVYPDYPQNPDFATYTDSPRPIPNRDSNEITKYNVHKYWIMVKDYDFTIRELSLMYYGFITANNPLKPGSIFRTSFEDYALIVSFAEFYLQNQHIRKFDNFDLVFTAIDSHVLVHFHLLGETDISASQLAEFIRKEK